MEVIYVDECPICLIRLSESNKTIITFECGHIVHLDCLNQWKTETGNYSQIYMCPLCNENKNIIGVDNPIITIPENIFPASAMNREVDNSCMIFIAMIRDRLSRIF